MFKALRLGLRLSLAGQASTQREHPVQSSGLMARTNSPESSFHMALRWGNPGGAPRRASSGTTLARITAWGQTRTHFPHWTQTSGSQVGTNSAIPRFSYRAVPVG